MAPPDAILGLTEAFNKDPNPDKINLGVGVHQDDSGRTPDFSAVEKAVKRLADQDSHEGYLPITGSAEYGAAVQALMFGADSEIIAGKRAAMY